MVKHVARMAYLVLDDQQPEWQDMDLVPASCKYESTEKRDEFGTLLSVEITGKLRRACSDFTRNLQVFVEFSDGETIILGTEFIPAHIETKEAQFVSFTLKYAARRV